MFSESREEIFMAQLRCDLFAVRSLEEADVVVVIVCVCVCSVCVCVVCCCGLFVRACVCCVLCVYVLSLCESPKPASTTLNRTRSAATTWRACNQERTGDVSTGTMHEGGLGSRQREAHAPDCLLVFGLLCVCVRGGRNQGRKKERERERASERERGHRLSSPFVV